MLKSQKFLIIIPIGDKVFYAAYIYIYICCVPNFMTKYLWNSKNYILKMYYNNNYY